MALTINDLKKKSATPRSILEKHLAISQDPSTTLKSINILSHDIQDLMTAITYKKDKIVSADLPSEIFEPLFSKFAKFNVKRIDSALLLLNSDVNEKKLLLRLLKLARDVDLNNFSAIVHIIENNDADDWCFLALFFRYTEREDAYCKEFKEKMIAGFQSALDKGDKYEMRRFFDALYMIDDWMPAVNLYICRFNALNVEVYFVEPEKIDIDFYNADTSNFFRYLEGVKLIFENDFQDLPIIFTNYREILQTITARVFGDFVSLRLENFLKTADPILFLMNLKVAFKKMKNLKLTADENILEIFDPYLAVAIKNEKQGIETIFAILSGATNNYRYISLGNMLKKEKNLKQMFLTALNYFNTFFERSEVLQYDEDDVESVSKYFIKKLEECLSRHGRIFEDIHIMSEIYTIAKVYFSARNLPCFEILSDFFQTELQTLFEELESLCKKKIKRVIKNMTISDFSGTVTTTSQKVMQILNSEFKNLPAGRNGNTYISSILAYTVGKIQAQIQLMSFNKEQALVLINDIESYLQFLKEHSMYGFLKSFEILKENTLLILVDENDLSIYIKTVGKRMERNEIKKWLKCRKDYQNVKGYLKE